MTLAYKATTQKIKSLKISIESNIKSLNGGNDDW